MSDKTRIEQLEDELVLARAEADAKGQTMLKMQRAAIDEKLRADKAEQERDKAMARLGFVATMRDSYEEQWRKIKERLDDWEHTHHQIMDEQCAGDEKHCTCVPNLRKGLKDLRDENDQLMAEIEEYREQVSLLEKSEDELVAKCNEMERQVQEVYRMRKQQLIDEHNLEMERRPVIGVAAMLLDGEGRLLLAERKGGNPALRGYYAPPGGHLEWMETCTDCAVRELYEETGLDADANDCEILGVQEGVLYGENHHYLTVFVYVKKWAGKPENIERDTHGIWEWYPLDKLPENILTTTSKIIDQLKDSV